MELLYFISGILSVGIVYAVLLLRKNQTHYNDAMDLIELKGNLFKSGLSRVEIELSKLTEFINEVKSTMEKDQYSSVSGINKKMVLLNEMTQAMNVRISENQKILETNISRTSVEINTIRNNIKQYLQDSNANFIRS